MRLARLGVCVVAVCLVLSCTACSSSETTEEQASPEQVPQENALTPTEAEEAQVETSAEESGIAEWITGSWAVDFALTSVDPDADWSRQAAGQPSAAWSCKVNGSEMVLDAGLHVYTGTLVADGDGWNYDATATWIDEGGVTWTSHIVVEGERESEDAFSAEQWGEISSDQEGTLYVATWDAIGTRGGQ